MNALETTPAPRSFPDFLRSTWLVSLATVSVAALGPMLGSCRETTGAEPIRVAAAADLALAFAELGAAHERETGRRVIFSFGSTGLLARQIAEGAPFDAFAAASPAYIDRVVAAAACDGATRSPLARGQLAIFARGRDAGASPLALEDLARPSFRRIAIASPEHAPYGAAARQALERAGVWALVEPRLVYGENVRQTLRLAETGNVDAAVVAGSLRGADEASGWSAVDERLHAPIDQSLVLCSGGASLAGGRAFAERVASPGGREVLRRHGFLPPGDAPGAP